MTAKDHKRIARALRRAYRKRIRKDISLAWHAGPILQIVVDELATALEHDNHQFNRQKFINYINN
jgi:hypothetical protein